MKRREDYGWLWKPKYSKVFNGKVLWFSEIKPKIDFLDLVLFYQGPKCKLDEVKRNFKKFIIKPIFHFL